MALLFVLPQILTLFILFNSISKAQVTRQSIYLLSSFSDLQPCAQTCFVWTGGYIYNGGCQVDNIASVIGCQYNFCKTDVGAPESCYCRPDLQTAALEVISKCVQTGCTIGNPLVELSSAVGLYEGYCTSRGYFATPASVAASTTPASGAVTVASSASPISSIPLGSLTTVAFSPGAATTPTVATIPLSNQPAQTNASSSGTDASGLSQSDKIALGCGISIPLAGLIIGYLSYREQRKAAKAKAQAGANGSGVAVFG